tara:strand:+ start:2080 stop:2754 length:675 start_codon:yes stop_codon:yes gene_type:complete
MQDNVLVTILTYNEENNISNVLKDVCEQFKNVLVVDNNSEDLTIEKVKKFPVYLVKHKYNLGKSESMKTALKLAKIKKFKYLAFMDGDGQHRTNDLVKICKKIFENQTHLIIGYRENLKNLNSKKRFGTIVLQRLFQILYQKKIYDIQSGLRVFDISIEKKIHWQSSGISHYFADAEITCNATKNSCKIEQIPIETLPSEKYKGMNTLQGMYLIIMMLFWRFIA